MKNKTNAVLLFLLMATVSVLIKLEAKNLETDGNPQTLSLYSASANADPGSVTNGVVYGASVPFHTYDVDNTQVFRYSPDAVVLTNHHGLTKEAFNKRCVNLGKKGSFVEFTSKHESNTLLVRYSLGFYAPENKTYPLQVFVNQKKAAEIPLSAFFIHSTPGADNQYRKAPENTKLDRIFRWWDEAFTAQVNVKPGDVVRLVNENESKEIYLDLVDLEMVDSPRGKSGDKPDTTWVSLEDCGAKPNDGKDDYDAFIKALDRASTGNKKVWIPKGRFETRQSIILKKEYAGITIEGAGIWHSELYLSKSAIENPAARHIFGLDADHITIRHFRMDGTGNYRRYLKGELTKEVEADWTKRRANRINNGMHINGDGSHSLIENMWFFHKSAGIWAHGSHHTWINNRIRSTYADGLHIENASSYNVVTNNYIRGPGDDALAIITHTKSGKENLFAHNTVFCGYMGRGSCFRGGIGNVIEYNWIQDSNTSIGILVDAYDKKETSPIKKMVIRGNLVVNTGKSSNMLIVSRIDPVEALVENNVLINSIGGAGLDLNGKTEQMDLVITNNVIINSSKTFLKDITPTKSIRIENNFQSSP